MAGFYADININNGGEILFRQTNDSDLLARFQADFTPVFSPTSLLIATWLQVPPLMGLSSVRCGPRYLCKVLHSPVSVDKIVNRLTVWY